MNARSPTRRLRSAGGAAKDASRIARDRRFGAPLRRTPGIYYQVRPARPFGRYSSQSGGTSFSSKVASHSVVEMDLVGTKLRMKRRQNGFLRSGQGNAYEVGEVSRPTQYLRMAPPSPLGGNDRGEPPLSRSEAPTSGLSMSASPSKADIAQRPGAEFTNTRPSNWQAMAHWMRVHQ